MYVNVTVNYNFYNVRKLSRYLQSVLVVIKTTVLRITMCVYTCLPDKLHSSLTKI